MTMFETPQVTPLGATALLARFGDAIDRELSLRIAALVDRLDRRRIDGVVDLVLSYTTLVVQFNVHTTDSDTVMKAVTGAWSELVDSPLSDNPDTRTIDIPVVYGGEAGPDLKEVASNAELSLNEVIRRHSDATYTVGALGFAPGFAFLIGLPPELGTPRRSPPRTRVPPGSVGIGGAQTGIYSLPTPGGWSLIGRTPRVMFDPQRESEDELRPGDRVRFVPTAAEDAPPFSDPSIGEEDGDESSGALEVVDAGVQTSVQDLGRPGQGRLGITTGGALDRAALVAGNRLLGNAGDAAALEWTLLPPAVRFHETCRIVLTGADPGWRLNDRPVAIGEVVDIGPGDELRAQPSPRTMGARGYVCVAGGIKVPLVRESRSLDLSAGFGGGFGRPLQMGDRLPIGATTQDTPKADNELVYGRQGDPAAAPFRVVRGPQADRFDENAWTTFLSGAYAVDAQSNRMGLRLNGPPIVPQGGADVISEGVVTGAVQVTGGGQPIVLLPGRATIGGYTKIATVIEADHDRLGQLRPGATMRFAAVSLDEARAALRQGRPSVYGGLRKDTSGESAMTTNGVNRASPELTSEGAAWTPDGVIRVIRELADHDVQAFSLRVESAGLEIAIDRGGGMSGRPGRVYQHAEQNAPNTSTDNEQSDIPDEADNSAVTAPLLGTFYRRTSPDAPQLVDEGDTVEVGQTVAIIEVMKTYHDVTAPTAGSIGRVLVEDGATVEFGQALMELGPSQEG